MDLRIQIEATLLHLFGREITLEWDSGNLVPRATRTGRTASYRLDRDECHGIKELLVLLTHLYDQEHRYLIIDEPELNLHPQYQAFFMQEVQKIAGDPETNKGKKVVFLVTHSPFAIDLRSVDNLKSVISFDLKYSVPKQVLNLDQGLSFSTSFVLRLNSHHKQLFFSDNPVFVEGNHDARLVEAMMEARGVSVAGAGSCIIDTGGADEVNKYLKLCKGLGKDAHFVYDLDSLFGGNLRACIKEDESVQSFLASAGLGNNFAKYCGELDGKLTPLIKSLVAADLPPSLSPLAVFLKKLGDVDCWDRGRWSKARTAVMTAISRHGEEIASVVSPQAVKDLDGRWQQILTALKQKNIHVLPGGTLERYLPCYTGDEYEIQAGAKRAAVDAEIEEMASLSTDELSTRYGELFDVVCSLPSMTQVDVEPVVRKHLSKFIFELQRIVVSNSCATPTQIKERLKTAEPSLAGVFSIEQLECSQDGGFKATIGITEMLGQGRRVARVSDQTNAGMGDYEIELVGKAGVNGA